jgi:hypothetical protein
MDVYSSGAIAARQIAEGGGTGLYDHLIDDSSMVDATGELAKANAILAAKSAIPVEVSGVTDQAGLRPGQVLAVSLTVPNAAASVLIDTVDAVPLAGAALRYTFHGSTAAYDDWVAVWNRALSGAGGGGGVSTVAGSGGVAGTESDTVTIDGAPVTY